MDKTKPIKSEEHKQSESSAGDDPASDPNNLELNSESFENDAVEIESKGSDTKNAPNKPFTKDDTQQKTIETDQAPEIQKDIKPTDEQSVETSESVDEADRKKDRQTHLRETEAASSSADPGDSEKAAPGKKDAKNAQQPENQDARAAVENAPKNSDKANAAETDEGQTEVADSETDQTGESASPDSAEGDVEKGLAEEEKRPAKTDGADRKATADADDEDDQPIAEAQAADGQETQTDDVEDERPATSNKRKSWLKIVVSAALMATVSSGFFIFENKSKIKTIGKQDQQTSQNEVLRSRTHRKEILDIQSSVTPSIYDGQINEISELRDTLLKKQAEVLALKISYQHGIEELEKEILDERRKADIHSFLQATGNKRIVFKLKTIQRRQAYIRQLKQPFEWVSMACEELLYIKRRAMLDLEVSAIASGIDMNKHARQMQVALIKYQPTAEKLAIDPTDAQLESLETIWERVQNKQDQISTALAYSKNQIISDQICAGDFNRLSELSEISAETAKCIIQMQASDLFLNHITEISPGASRLLCQWKGSWLCMNGIRALSPRVAHYLFQWDGNWISLNGLTEFPAEIGAALLKWEGMQLELMGLQYTGDSQDRIGIEYLAQWERSGGKLFVPQNLREKIDALHRESS